jgi:hypothetical protein
MNLAFGNCGEDWVLWEENGKDCQECDIPGCEEAHCYSGCFRCEWEDYDPINLEFWEVCCDDGAANSTCKLVVSRCEGVPGCCTGGDCPENDNCPKFDGADRLPATIWNRDLIEDYGCCLGYWHFRIWDDELEECILIEDYITKPKFCAMCEENSEVTTEFISYWSPYIMGFPYSWYADCSSIHDCFTEEETDWENPECGEVGIAEVDSHHCCACEMV